MFAPPINVDLEKLQQEAEAKPPVRKTASRGRTAAPRKAEQKTEKPADK